MQRTIAFLESSEGDDLANRALTVPVIEAAALSDEELDEWRRLRPRLLAVWYDAEVTTSPERILVDDAYFALRLLWVHGGLTLSIPVFATGTDAPASVTHLVGDILEAVEATTGLSPYDTASGSRFELEAPGAATASLSYGLDAASMRATPTVSRTALTVQLFRALAAWAVIIFTLVVLAPYLGTRLVVAVVSLLSVFWVIALIAVLAAARRARRARR